MTVVELVRLGFAVVVLDPDRRHARLRLEALAVYVTYEIAMLLRYGIRSDLFLIGAGGRGELPSGSCCGG